MSAHIEIQRGSITNLSFAAEETHITITYGKDGEIFINILNPSNHDHQTPRVNVNVSANVSVRG